MNPASLPLLATVLIAGAVAVSATPNGSPQPPDMVEMEVAGVFPLEGGQAAMLVLREKGQETLLPIVVGRGEADAIEMRLERREPSRPRVQELLKSTIDALGGRVVRVEIRDASEALYRARVHLAQGSQRLELEARPSDSVVLALSAAAPIYAARQLVREAGLTREDLRRMNEGAEPTPSPVIPDISSTEHRM
jgi:uncharacterized protein